MNNSDWVSINSCVRNENRSLVFRLEKVTDQTSNKYQLAKNFQMAARF